MTILILIYIDFCCCCLYLGSHDLPPVLQLPPQASRRFLLLLQRLPQFLGHFLQVRGLSLGPLTPPPLLRAPRLRLSQLFHELRLPAPRVCDVSHGREVLLGASGGGHRERQQGHGHKRAATVQSMFSVRQDSQGALGEGAVGGPTDICKKQKKGVCLLGGGLNS